MKINNHEFNFAFTIGAYIAIDELKLANDASGAVVARAIAQQAVIMSKEYEDRAKLLDPEHEVRYLTLPEVYALDFASLKRLTQEITAAKNEGSKITVKTAPKKKAAAEE